MKNEIGILTNIKSNYILKFIMSLLEKSKKLEIIIYSKKFQNKLDINIEDYKNFSGRYKVAERNGLGKEYLIDTKILVFEGNYKNGKKNGEGKEYYEKGEIFEGNYISGRLVNGKKLDKEGKIMMILENYRNVKEYFNNRKIRFEGEYLYKRRWNGIGYNYNGDKAYEIRKGNGWVKDYDYYTGALIFEGEYLDGLKNGKVKEFFGNGNILFVGEYSYGKKNGKAKEYYMNGLLKFEGEYLHGKKNGRGKEYYEKGEIFEGNYINGKKVNGITLNKEGKVIMNFEKDGKVEEYFNNGKIKFKGEYLNEKKWNGIGFNYTGGKAFEIKEGKGFVREYDYSYGSLYFEGEYLNGERNGKGKEFYGNGNILFVGEYLNGKRFGQGKEYNKFGQLKFEGEYRNGKRIGKGKKYNEIGKLIFEGEYLDGLKNGKAKEYENGNILFEGNYKNGKKNGKGKDYLENGEIFEGNYLNGTIVNGKKLDKEGKIMMILENNGKIKEYFNNGKIRFEGEYLYKKRWNGIGYNYNGDKVYVISKGNGWVKDYDYYTGALIFEGEYLDGLKNGKVKEYYMNGSLKFEGKYSYGKKNGKAKEYYMNGGLKFEGEYSYDKKNGKVKEYNIDGKLNFEGEYLIGKKLDYHSNDKLEHTGENANKEKKKDKCMIY